MNLIPDTLPGSLESFFMAMWGNQTQRGKLGTLTLPAFYGTIDIDKFCDLYRIPAELPDDLVKSYLRDAVFCVMDELWLWQIQQNAASLDDVEQSKIDGVGRLRASFERACYCLAKGTVLRETQSIIRRDAAENAAKTGEQTEDKYMEWASDAIRQITAKKRICVEII